ncbi:hypothetical protein ACTFIU_001802 [Dictyostelium citrinum]
MSMVTVVIDDIPLLHRFETEFFYLPMGYHYLLYQDVNIECVTTNAIPTDSNSKSVVVVSSNSSRSSNSNSSKSSNSNSSKSSKSNSSKNSKSNSSSRCSSSNPKKSKRSGYQSRLPTVQLQHLHLPSEICFFIFFISNKTT